MPKRTGREFKVLALIFGPLFILFIVLSAFQYHHYTNNRLRVRRQLERRQDLETELAAARLQSYAREITSALERLSASIGSSKNVSEKYEDIGKAFDSLGGKVERLSYLDGEGRKVYSVLGNGPLIPLPENCRYEDFFIGPKLAMVPFISPLAMLANKEEVIYFSYPVKDSSTGTFAGVVLAQVSRSSFAGLCKRIKEVDPDICFVYYSQLGDPVCLENCFQKGGSLARKELMTDVPASEVVGLGGAPGPGTRVAYHPVRIEGYRWYMTSEMPLSLVDSLAEGDTLTYSAAGALFLLSLIAGGLYFRRVYMGKAAAESEAAYQTSLAAKNDAFEAERDKLLAVLNGVPDGIILLDSEGKVIDVNASIRNMAGMQTEGQPGKVPDVSGLDIFLGPLEGPVDKTVGEKTYRVIPVPAHEEVGGAPGEVRIVRDVTMEKSIERKRKDMVSMITHDIKNPLAAIIGTSEWLRNDKIKPCLGDDGIAAVEAINRAATRILALSENLLLSTDEGTPRQPKVQVDVGAFLEKVIAEFYLEAKQKSVTIRHNVNEISAVMQMDEQQMMRAFSNLINNSLRHTPEGGEITVVAKDFRDYVTISISDTGPGISKSDLPHMFEKNYWASDGKERTRKTGLGLSIAKNIIEAHGGIIEFVSDEQYPAMIVVRLPISSQA